MAHASGFLADRYAPADSDDKMGVGTPPAIDRDLEAHRIASMAIVVYTGYILREEWVPSKLAGAPAVAFHEVH